MSSLNTGRRFIRMDALIQVELPSPVDRLQFIVKIIHQDLLGFLSVSEQELMRELVNTSSDLYQRLSQDCAAVTQAVRDSPHSVEEFINKLLNKLETILSTATPAAAAAGTTNSMTKGNSIEREYSPESDHCERIEDTKPRNSPRTPLESLIESYQGFLERHLFEFSMVEMHLLVGIEMLVIHTERWSFREIAKKLTNLRYSILCSESCRLTDQLWMREICYDYQNQYKNAVHERS